ncbi:hypothetical protein BB561_002822 [Smittium simulii]|uniref:Chitin-binding type-2 domain-containing protein n=1 Tax=Smittium simulii TaxID=133385 RepID=A0A2T9YP21_9FUNG|nr:hypothetical protein BB561_002822 [Smittium simulii]
MFKSFLKVGFFSAIVAVVLSQNSINTNTDSTPDNATDDYKIPCYNGDYTCLGRNSLSFYQCSNGNYILRSCGPGTVTYPNKSNYLELRTQKPIKPFNVFNKTHRFLHLSEDDKEYETNHKEDPYKKFALEVRLFLADTASKNTQLKKKPTTKS